MSVVVTDVEGSPEEDTQAESTNHKHSDDGKCSPLGDPFVLILTLINLDISSGDRRKGSRRSSFIEGLCHELIDRSVLIESAFIGDT